MAIPLIAILSIMIINFGESAFTPRGKPINYISSDNNILKFNGDTFSGTYELELPTSLQVKDSDKIDISYIMNHNEILAIDELMVNGTKVLNKLELEKLSLKMLMN